jgi:hypothetical protein
MLDFGPWEIQTLPWPACSNQKELECGAHTRTASSPIFTSVRLVVNLFLSRCDSSFQLMQPGLSRMVPDVTPAM